MIEQEDDYFGVYELADSDGDIVYIGQGRVRQRLSAHYRAAERLGLVHKSIRRKIGRPHDGYIGRPKRSIAFFRCEYVGSKERAEQRERAEQSAYMSQHGELPVYCDRLG